jgi:hypothetical protein
MIDILYLLVVFIFFAASLGFLAIVGRLMER